MFILDTSQPPAQIKWQRLSDGPVGAALAFFTLHSFETTNKFYVFGGVDARGSVKSFLWSMQLFDDADPLWTLDSLEGPQRMQHCACTVKSVVYVWGGMTGTVLASLMCCIWYWHTSMLAHMINSCPGVDLQFPCMYV